MSSATKEDALDFLSPGLWGRAQKVHLGESLAEDTLRFIEELPQKSELMRNLDVEAAKQRFARYLMEASDA